MSSLKNLVAISNHGDAIGRKGGAHSAKSKVIVAKRWAMTEKKLHQISYRWIIKQVSFYCEDVGKKIESPTFSTDDNQLEWRLELYPKGDREEAGDFMAIYLKLVSMNCPSRITAKYKFAILNAEGKETHVHYDNRADAFAKGSSWGYDRIILWNSIFEDEEGLLCDDTLTILCEVQVATDVVNSFSHSTSADAMQLQHRLVDDLEKLFQTMPLTDVTLVVGRREFQAHKTLLAARSPVFATMFENGMKEKHTNRVDICDLDELAFQQVLRFIYTDRVENLEDLAQDLLTAADKYGLQRLKYLCEEEMARQLSVENATQFLILADRHSALELKRRVEDFINVRSSEIANTAGWKSLVKYHPTLIANMYMRLMKM